MSFGKMNGFASIVSIQRVKDSEGFTTEHFLIYGGERFDITSVEDVKGRGMYTEVLGKRTVSSIG